jgi:hypothetical protein
MAAFHPQVMKGTSHFHHRIRKAIFGIAENIFHNATTFDTCNRIFNTDPGSGNDAVQTPISLAQLLAFRFFLAET